MKKIIIGSLAALGLVTTLRAQPVSDHAVIPVAVTLNEILRIHVTEGGNIEFVFNQIEQYRDGIDNTATSAGVDVFYNTSFVVAASASWELDFGAEFSVLNGVDNPANTMALNNVGFEVSEMGTASCCLAASDITAASNAVGSGIGGGTVNGLAQFGGTFSPLMTSGTGINSGDITENSFIIHWECGTAQVAGTGASMNTATLLNQSLAPDRYVSNVFLDLNDL